MPRDKDLKRVVRTRMQKTGESYTSARANVLSKSKKSSANDASQTQAPEPDYAALARQSDSTVIERTGRSWKEWVHELDARRAFDLPHRDIATLLRDEYALPMWWTQQVTVGYERIKGLRDVNQRRDGGFEASRSKTFATPLAELFELAANGRRRARWWPGVKVEAKPANRTPIIRTRHDDDSVTTLNFIARNDGRTTLTVVGSGLPDRDAVDAFKATWGERLASLADMIG